MMKHRINIVFIGIFILCISLPYLFAHRDSDGRVSSMENRMLAAYPSLWSEEGDFNKEYPVQFENWLDDNIRGRSLLMEINSTLQYRIFERIVKSDVMQGKDHWLFVEDSDMIKEYQRLNLLSEEELDEYANKMQGISDYLKDRGIEFYYFQCYSKEEIYPDKYVPGINRIGTISKADQIVDVLQTKTDIKQIIVKEPLLEHADDMVYFQFVDFLHWNERGSFLGYQILMDEIQRDFEQVPVLQESDFLIEEDERRVELYGYEYPYAEMCPVYTVREPKAVEITETTQDRWDFLHFKEHTHDYLNESGVNDLKILLVGDSFVRMFLKDDIAESFYRTLSIDWLNIPIIDEVIEEYQPDIVVFESAQSALENTVELVGQAEFVK